MEDFAGSPTALVADVDCTTEGKGLCEKHGVQGYPSIKHGNPDSLEDYEGGRTYDDLKKFADENLGPSCGPDNLELCNDEMKALVEKFQKMSTGKIEAKIRKAEAKVAKLNEDFESLQKGLQNKYEAHEKSKDAKIADIKGSGLGLMKSCLAYRKTQGEKPKDEL